ncbi:amino acid adenylation domain-containing protein [Vibrio pectenicida]|uniref:Amino acid adenylation domain-containing protein n=1 Tax=Vibrio pectenicida TaxID=62763 RepID=A0A7Y3ZZC7_9VIBR|nr:amino acid adenylation domain-containing protein [Vibrio pectenicida]NOH71875.1 amino acid adenylation domain-containing protein [Vibrio pectenicida]
MKQLLHFDFHESTALFPDNIAIEEENGVIISYAELNRLANKYKGFLLDTSILSPYVAILSEVNSDSIASILGVLKSKKTYVPLDVQSPHKRLKKIIENLEIQTIIVDNSLILDNVELLKHPKIKSVLYFGTTQIDDSLPSNFINIESVNVIDDSVTTHNQVSDDLAYVLHTSGSTGNPKGIMLSHRNAKTFVDWMQKEFILEPNDKVMARAPLKFDLSVFDIFNTLSVGATIVCFDWNKKRSREQRHVDYVELLERSKATIMYSTPSTFITLKDKAGLGKNINNLRQIMYAGEPFPITQLISLKQTLNNVRVANIYGPTETNIITCFWVDEIDESWDSIPLGDVVDDTEIIVVSDDSNRICELNEVGELWCRGGTVTSGYVGQKELTDVCLIDSPFHLYPAKYWRTGDYGYLGSDGLLYYRGRKDHMIKANGYRIEIGEVESAISRHPDISEVCVIFKANSLVCHYSSKSGCKHNESTLVDFVSNHIPNYMIPNIWFNHYELPKTSSGKVDRQALAKKEDTI